MYCQPTCIKIVLNYAIDRFKIKQKKLTIKTIAKTIGTDPFWGTIPNNVEFINSRLEKTKPSIRFKRQLSGTYDDILSEITTEHPVIAWIDKREHFSDEVWHVVVINGVDPDLRLIYYCDPLLPEEYWQKTSPSGHFITNQLGPKGYLVKLIMGGVGQQTLINIDSEKIARES